MALAALKISPDLWFGLGVLDSAGQGRGRGIDKLVVLWSLRMQSLVSVRRWQSGKMKLAYGLGSPTQALPTGQQRSLAVPRLPGPWPSAHCPSFS